MSQPFVTVDAFTDQPFGGNPAAVCLLEHPREDAWMQQVALEMNCSETAFLQPRPDGFGLRWFTPTTEVPLCGHATLASAHALWEAEVVPATVAIQFFTQSGVLRAERDGAWIRLTFPLVPFEAVAATPADVAVLGCTPIAYARNRFVTVAQLPDEAAVRNYAPVFDRLRTLPGLGVGITARSAVAAFDVVSRFFAPQSGINEDPATGAAHVALASFWPAQLGKTTFVAYQASARGAVFRVTAHPDRVELSGQAITTLCGTILA